MLLAPTAGMGCSPLPVALYRDLYGGQLYCGVRVLTMRFPLIRKNGPIFIGNLGLFWIYFYGFMGNAYLAWYPTACSQQINTPRH